MSDGSFPMSDGAWKLLLEIAEDGRPFNLATGEFITNKESILEMYNRSMGHLRIAIEALEGIAEYGCVCPAEGRNGVCDPCHAEDTLAKIYGGHKLLDAP